MDKPLAGLKVLELARILAGGSIDEEWRERGIGLWWELASAEGRAQGRPQR